VVGEAWGAPGWRAAARENKEAYTKVAISEPWYNVPK